MIKYGRFSLLFLMTSSNAMMRLPSQHFSCILRYALCTKPPLLRDREAYLSAPITHDEIEKAK